MEDTKHRFFLQAIDPDHGAPVFEAAFDVVDVDVLRAILELSVDEDPLSSRWYVLAAGELAEINDRYGVGFEPGDREVRLESSHPLRATPYLVHTMYELALLLNGAKKLARFAEAYPPGDHYDEVRFERYVSEGLLSREVYCEPLTKPRKAEDGRIIEGIRHVSYTPKGEEWRIPAPKLMWAAAHKSGWNESFERLEGMLFGYEEWQMDWWIDHLRKRKGPDWMR